MMIIVGQMKKGITFPKLVLNVVLHREHQHIPLVSILMHFVGPLNSLNLILKALILLLVSLLWTNRMQTI